MVSVRPASVPSRVSSSGWWKYAVVNHPGVWFGFRCCPLLRSCSTIARNRGSQRSCWLSPSISDAYREIGATQMRPPGRTTRVASRSLQPVAAVGQVVERAEEQRCISAVGVDLEVTSIAELGSDSPGRPAEHELRRRASAWGRSRARCAVRRPATAHALRRRRRCQARAAAAEVDTAG